MLKKRLGTEAIERNWSSVVKLVYCYFKIPSTLTISESCEKIGDRAFECCWKLRKVIIPGSVEVIGDYAFAGCTNTKVIVGPWNRIKDIGRNAFKDCIVKYEIC